MRVSHVITRLVVGGAQENTVSSVLGLREIPGVEVDLISGPTTGPEGTLEPIVARIPGLLTLVPDLVRPVKPWQDWKALRDLEKIFRRFKPDIVHTHSGKAGVVGRLAAHRAGVPLIVHTIHGASFGSFQGPVANAIFSEAERIAAAVTDHFVVVANAMTDQYLAAGIGRPGQFTQIFSGFDINPFLSARNDLELREQLGIAPDDFVVGKVARLVDLKGHDDLFAIAPALVKQCPNIKFLFVGDGMLRDRFASTVAKLGLTDRFVFTGLVRPAEVPRYVGIMDVLVHLSRREGLPRALPQAMAAGKPVVAFDCDGAREVCLSHQTGFLLPAGDHAGLTLRLTELCRHLELRERLGQQGQAMVRDAFPIQRMVDDLHSLYQRLLAR
ncbi:MAG: glycosyltransferase family 4 protein [Opitutaceae bacterium]|nr:glycosyltransferase family 4 protein [Verrucomicrobiales bacterium]